MKLKIGKERATLCMLTLPENAVMPTKYAVEQMFESRKDKKLAVALPVYECLFQNS